MGWLGGLLRFGSDELGWDDLVRHVADAVGRLARYGEKGRVAFPPDVTVRIEVAEGSVAVLLGFVQKPEFDREVRAAVANRCDCPADELPLLEYQVAAATALSIQALEGSAKVWSFEIEGGDRSGQAVPLPSGRKEARLGRGEWHGSEPNVRNELVVCDATEFVSRRAGRIHRAGHHLEVEALDQGDALSVLRVNGETIRPARTASGRVAIEAGDVIVIAGGGGETVRLTVRRSTAGEDHGGAHR